MNQYEEEMTSRFRMHKNAQQAEKMEKYMKNKFPFLGLKTPERSSLLKEFIAEKGLPEPENLLQVVHSLWNEEEREFQYTALHLLTKQHKQMDRNWIAHLETLITEKSWWDTVDTLASQLCGTYFTRFPEEIDRHVMRWLDSGNIWLQRSAVLFQLKYKDKTDEELLYRVVVRLQNEDEFFIKKAIGWALREYGKTAPDSVRYFVQSRSLAPLSRREAMKHLK
ncbi:DNA alkylation repair protein [Bacillus marinisedimentorum]|uniref:DNA alkylation repair protein n=1 Tax=Bacillus marinisedimentorum TaxID=1821260 RepID=UPI0007DF490F|nr:DNA alkylation repair protein [Bacillus marinisedimentorum]